MLTSYVGWIMPWCWITSSITSQNAFNKMVGPVTIRRVQSGGGDRVQMLITPSESPFMRLARGTGPQYPGMNKALVI